MRSKGLNARLLVHTRDQCILWRVRIQADNVPGIWLHNRGPELKVKIRIWILAMLGTLGQDVIRRWVANPPAIQRSITVTKVPKTYRQYWYRFSR